MAGADESVTLRVAKAIPSDVGHGRARVPFNNDLDLKPGDIIEISGENKTAAVVWRCRPEDANLGVIRIDGIIRKNAGVSLGDRVDVRKVEVKKCERLVLSPVMAKQQKVRFGPAPPSRPRIAGGLPGPSRACGCSTAVADP